MTRDKKGSVAHFESSSLLGSSFGHAAHILSESGDRSGARGVKGSGQVFLQSRRRVVLSEVEKREGCHQRQIVNCLRARHGLVHLSSASVWKIATTG